MRRRGAAQAESRPVGGEWFLGSILLLPPIAYVIGGWDFPGFGPPFMITFLYGPGSNHSTIGLVLLLVGKILCPLAAAALGAREGVRRRSAAGRRIGWSLGLAGSILLLVNLATRQPVVP